MKRSLETHAARFDRAAESYDEDASPEYRAAADLVVEHAAPRAGDVVLDLGTGTGTIALALAADAQAVIGRDISRGMLEQAREKADERSLENVTVGEDRFREPNVPRETAIDVVVSNFALHHLDDEAKREAIETIAGLDPRRFVLGDVMLFGRPDSDAAFFSPAVDDPATVGVLADALTDVGFVVRSVERVDEQVGVLVAERTEEGDAP